MFHSKRSYWSVQVYLMNKNEQMCENLFGQEPDKGNKICTTFPMQHTVIVCITVILFKYDGTFGSVYRLLQLKYKIKGFKIIVHKYNKKMYCQ